VDTARQIVAIYPQPLARCKPKPAVNCKRCSYVRAYHYAQLSYTTQHRIVLIWS